MASPVWRGDDPGFQTQATGNYPDKSDVADKDNIYLSDRGWVYRHFKSKDKSKYWDEIIWAGHVTDPPNENDPVDLWDGNVPPADPEFLVGDGFQFVSGPYPSADPAIGTVNIESADNFDTEVAVPFSITVTGAVASANTYTWTSSPEGAVFNNATGTFGGSDPSAADTTVTIADAGTYTIQCLVKTAADSATGSIGQKAVVASVNVPADVIDAKDITGQKTPPVSSTIVYTANQGDDATAPEGDITYTWTTTDSTAAVVAAGSSNNVGAGNNKVNIAFGAQGTFTVQCVMSDASASPTSETITLSVTTKTAIGTPVVAGPGTATAGAASTAFSLTYTDQSSPAPGDLTYQWSATPSTGVSLGSATAATTTVTATDADTYSIKCVVSSATSQPTDETSDAVALVVS